MKYKVRFKLFTCILRILKFNFIPGLLIVLIKMKEYYWLKIKSTNSSLKTKNYDWF